MPTAIQMRSCFCFLLQLLMDDPGAFVLVGYLGSVIDQWCSRLGLNQAMVSRLVATQPALLEMSPGTVKARLVSETLPPSAAATRERGREEALGYSHL